MSRTNPFANLFAVNAGAKKGESDEDVKPDAEGDERKKKDGESDDEYAKRMKALDEKEEKEAEDKKPEEDAKKKGEDKKDGDKEAAAHARGIKAERERWSTVLKSEDAMGRGATACMLLAETELDAKTICKTLGTTSPAAAAAPATPLARRMAAAAAETPVVQPGGPEVVEAGSASDIARQVNAAAALARGEKPTA